MPNYNDLKGYHVDKRREKQSPTLTTAPKGIGAGFKLAGIHASTNLTHLQQQQHCSLISNYINSEYTGVCKQQLHSNAPPNYIDSGHTDISKQSPMIVHDRHA